MKNIRIFDNMNIKEKIKFLEQISQPPKERTSSLKTEVGIEQVIEGEIIKSAYGETFIKTIEFEITQNHGTVILNQIDELSPYYLKLAGKDENLLQLNLRNSLFFDTETTGLAGGSGTHIFMAGFGYFEKNSFIIKQFFLRDFPEEPAMLHSIHDLMKQFDSIISFNGKSFDLPLLKSRFIFHRIKMEFAEPVHLDLLHAARRVWKNSLPDCSLGTLERQVLKVYRNGDVPSYLIPHLFFEYLRTKDARPMKQIFYHNEIDILSMVTLTIILHHLHKSPLQQLSNKTDLMTLAKHYENIQQWETNIAIYKVLIDSEKNAERKKYFGIKLGYCYKRTGQWEQAERLWFELIKQGNFLIEPFEELAKYYEHRVRNLKQAEQVVQTALNKIDLIEQLYDNSTFSMEKESLLHRLNRIQRKLNE